jgi:uncharacterized protein (TIGR00251 family)
MSDRLSATLDVRVRPRAGRRDVQMGSDGRVRVMVTEPPDAGKANAAVEALLAERLGIPKRDVRVIRGMKSRDKVVEAMGLDRAEALARLSSR